MDVESEILRLRTENEELKARIELLARDYAVFALPDCPALHFSRQQRALLKALYERMPATVSNDALFHILYGLRPECDVPGESTLKVMICNIRRRLVGTRYRLITEWGSGYRLQGDARV